MRLVRITFRYQIENIIDILLHFRHYNSSLSLPDDCSTNETEYSTQHKGLYRDCGHEYNMQWKYKKEVPKSALLQNSQMIRLSPADLKRTVNLLYEKETNELMRQRKMRE